MSTTMSTPSANTSSRPWRLTATGEGTKTLYRIFVGDEQKSRCTAVSLTGDAVLQVKPTKTPFASTTEWATAAIKSIGLSTENPGATAAIAATVEAAAAAQPAAPAETDARRLHRLARKYGVNPSQVTNMSQNAQQLFWHSYHVKNPMPSPPVSEPFANHMNQYRQKRLAALTKQLETNPVEFYSVKSSPLYWKDGDTFRQIGLLRTTVDKEGCKYGKFPYENKIVNDRGVVGTTLAELGIPVDAEFHVMKVERIVKRTLVKAV